MPSAPRGKPSYPGGKQPQSALLERKDINDPIFLANGRAVENQCANSPKPRDHQR